jgi:hypothetical protein
MVRSDSRPSCRRPHDFVNVSVDLFAASHRVGEGDRPRHAESPAMLGRRAIPCRFAAGTRDLGTRSRSSRSPSRAPRPGSSPGTHRVRARADPRRVRRSRPRRELARRGARHRDRHRRVRLRFTVRAPLRHPPRAAEVSAARALRVGGRVRRTGHQASPYGPVASLNRAVNLPANDWQGRTGRLVPSIPLPMGV